MIVGRELVQRGFINNVDYPNSTSNKITIELINMRGTGQLARKKRSVVHLNSNLTADNVLANFDFMLLWSLLKAESVDVERPTVH